MSDQALREAVQRAKGNIEAAERELDGYMPAEVEKHLRLALKNVKTALLHSTGMLGEKNGLA